MNAVRKVRVLINPKSGLVWSFGAMQAAFERFWSDEHLDLTYQFSRSPADGKAKTERAISDGVDSIIVVGGDGMVNTIGSVLVDTSVALGVIPTGSGNGFARHFGIPLNPEQAVKALHAASKQRIDVGRVNGRPFFVTCSMAWDAALVRSFEKSPVRGILPYVFSAVYEYLGYVPHPFQIRLDGKKGRTFNDPIMLTVANLTQYGGGARVAPNADAADGQLELVVLLKRDMPKVLPQIARLFDGTFTKIREVKTYSFKKAEVSAGYSGPVQVDGELLKTGPDLVIDVLPCALTVLVPDKE
ncbi:MAG: diacylglycerol kinase family protein [Kiritimatiellae bacterium]|nr:diacylglycerol kinase family protein [Kiritimatiellia bacterium]